MINTAVVLNGYLAIKYTYIFKCVQCMEFGVCGLGGGKASNLKPSESQSWF